MISDQEALRLAQEAKLEVDREMAAERRAAERAAAPEPDDDFEPRGDVPEFHRPAPVSREAALAALERGYGGPLPDRLRAAMLGRPAAPEEPKPERPVSPSTGRRKLGDGARRD